MGTLTVPLYKRTGAEKLAQWQIEIDGSKYRVHSGMVGGQITISDWRQAIGKNIGRTNETSPEDQAIIEANARIEAKRKEGYTADIKAVDTEKRTFSPMLAKEWREYRDKVVYPMYSQPKLDGIRCWMDSSGAYTRNGNPLQVVEFIHMSLLKVLQDNVILDGELYNHEYKSDFNRLVSVIKKSAPKAVDFDAARAIVQYHVYDLFDPSAPDMPFLERSHRLQALVAGNPWVVVVSTSPVSDQVGLDEVYAEYLRDGYEGQMVRRNTAYEQKRTSALLKRKEFFDAEYPIVRIDQAQGGREGCAILVLRTPDGSEFSSVVAGSVEYQRQIYNTREQYYGKLATIKYQNLTPGGIPRFPVATVVGRTDL